MTKRVKPVIQQAVPNWTRGECRGTLSSGEGLVYAVRDARGGDSGVEDKCLYLVQAEFGIVLKVMAREGNSLSGVIRDAWDGSDLAPMTKGDPIRATQPHIVIVGHVTKGELLKHLREEEAGNGFGNRFEYFAVRRSQILPFGGTPDPAVLRPLIEELRQGIAFASSVGEVGMTAEAKQGWIAVYPTLSEGKPGMVGALLARGEAHVRRLAALYALLDQQHEVHSVHLDAALALWDFSEASALWIFGDNTGDPIADKILQSLRSLDILNETEVSSLFYKNVPAARLDLAKHLLLNLKLAHTETLATGGRPIVMWKPGPAPSV